MAAEPVAEEWTRKRHGFLVYRRAGRAGSCPHSHCQVRTVSRGLVWLRDAFRPPPPPTSPLIRVCHRRENSPSLSPSCGVTSTSRCSLADLSQWVCVAKHGWQLLHPGPHLHIPQRLPRRWITREENARLIRYSTESASTASGAAAQLLARMEGPGCPTTIFRRLAEAHATG